MQKQEIHNSIVCHLSFNHNAFDDRIYWKELLSLQQNGYGCIHICVGEKEEDAISKEGIRIIQIKSKKFFRNVWANRFMQLILWKKSTVHAVFERAKAIHAQVYHYHDLQLNAIAKRLKRLPHHPVIIYDAHEAYHLLFQENAPPDIMLRSLYKAFTTIVKKWEIKTARYCNYIIATDHYTLNYFQQQLPAIPKSIIYNYSFFLPEYNRIEIPKTYDFIYTGLLSKGRGIKEIVGAAALLAKNFNDSKVLLIGPFETDLFRQEVQDLIIKLQLTNHIIWHEPVPFTEIQSYYQQSRIGLGLFHSTPKYTTFIPIKLFEYMTFGLPVIFANHGPSAKIIAEAGCGLCVDVNNLSEIANAMQTLLQNEQCYNCYSENAKKAVRENYSWKNEQQKLLHIYDELLALKKC